MSSLVVVEVSDLRLQNSRSFVAGERRPSARLVHKVNAEQDRASHEQDKSEPQAEENRHCRLD